MLFLATLSQQIFNMRNLNDVKLPEEDAVEDTGTPLSDDEIHQRMSLLRELPELLGWEPFMTILNE